MNVGVVGNPRYGDLAAVLAELAREAPPRGLSLFSEPRLAQFWGRDVPPVLDGAPLDALLTFGGDGTLLRGARLLAGAEVPILGINLGRVGFLTTTTRDAIPGALDALVSGNYITECLEALQGSILAPDGAVRSSHHALNDIALHRGGVARVVRVSVSIDDQEVGPYSADGLVVSTPTGSTAYSLSAGGPLVAPGVHGMLVTPICAHTLAVRPLVVPSSSRVVIAPMAGWAEDVLVSFDGQTGMQLTEGERIEVRRAPYRVCLARLDGEGWFTRMRQKLHWGDLSGREIVR
ncbi:MAG: NAD(+)/NADH kinase [Gemmatimonadales bacterium]|nr:NAD(+)/NADH kinase [Gemmatimonadales bacterium]